MNQPPLSRTYLIQIRNTTKNDQVRVLLREISRLHELVRTLRKMVKQVEIEIGNGHFDTLAFDRIEELLDPEMRLYGPPPYDYKRDRKQAQLEASEKLIDEALNREANVRKSRPISEYFRE